MSAPSSSPAAALAPRPAPSTAAIPSSKARRMQTKGRPSGRSRAAAGSANGSGADASPARQMHAILDMQGGSRSNKKSGSSSSSRQQAAESALPPSVSAPSADFMAQLSMVYNWMSRSEGAATAAAAAPQQQPLAQPKPRHAPRPARSPASSPSSSAPASRSQFVDSDSDAFSEGETDIDQEHEHTKQKKTAAAGAVDSNSYSLSDEESLPAAHVNRSPGVHSSHSSHSLSSSQQLVACEFRQFGCESLVSSERGSADPHYHSSYAHHLALLTAKHAILASQKSQLAVDVEATKRHAEEANAQVEHLQRKLVKKTDTIAKLRTKLQTKQAALQEAKLLRLSNVQELVSSYLDGGVPADAKALLRFQRKQIEQLKAQLKEKETLLTKVAEHIKSTNKNGEAAPTATATKATKPATAAAPVPSGPLFKVPAPVPFDPLRDAQAQDAKRQHPLGGRNLKPVSSMPVLMTSEPGLPVVHPVLRGVAPLLSPNQLMNLVTSLVTGQPPSIIYVPQGRPFGPMYEQQSQQQHQQQNSRQQQTTQQPQQQQQAPRGSPVVISSSRGDTDEELEEISFPFAFVTPSGAINTFDEPVSDSPTNPDVAPIGTHLGLKSLCPELWRKKFIQMKGGKGGQEGGSA